MQWSGRHVCNGVVEGHVCNGVVDMYAIICNGVVDMYAMEW